MWWVRKCASGHASREHTEGQSPLHERHSSPSSTHPMIEEKLHESYSHSLQSIDHYLPSLSYHKLRSLLLQCEGGHNASLSSECCAAAFFPVLEKELVAACQCFDRRARLLSGIHLASGFKKCVQVIRHKEARDSSALMHAGQCLLKYAAIITLATRELLEKYDEVHVSREGLAFKTCFVARHVTILQSPWLVELLALYFNLKSDGYIFIPETCPACAWDLEGGKPTLSFMPHESVKLEIEIMCSICLEIIFEPVALKCGHIFCLSCACSAASVLIIEGFKRAKKKAKCPLCRKSGVFTSTTRLMELHLLISTSCEDYWKNRFQRERKERLKEAKEYWTVMRRY